ncbi:MAG TPA: OmpA family protein [Bacteroidia bacterium]|nr:OmpA family protein [Bacteroidia bacterium]
MNKTYRYFTFVAVIVMSCITNSCKMVDKANMHYEEFAYAKAIPIYKKALAKDTMALDAESWYRFGYCYRANNQTALAEECYAKIARSKNPKDIYTLSYAEMLMENGKYAEASTWMNKYINAVPTDGRAIELARGLSNIETFFTEKDYFKVQKLNISSMEAEFGPAFYKDGIVFTSSRSPKKNAKDVHDWTGKRFYSLFYSQGKGATFNEPVIFLEGVQDKYNNSSLCFNKQGTEMILTRNNLGQKRRALVNNEILRLKLFFSTLVDGKWTDVVPFKYNSDTYSCAHAALSPDGNRLYFSSDMPGSIGGMDLWYCDRRADGWSMPQNMGPGINTLGNEVFPTVAGDNTIYFSSNGHAGIGGLDIYSTRDSAEAYTIVHNLGAPFNSSDDDFNLIYDSTNTAGYISSNRNQQEKNDDIFYIQKFEIKLKGIVLDKRTNELLAASNVRIIEENMEPTDSRTSEDGLFRTALRPNKNYLIIADHDEYNSDTLRLDASTIKAAGDSIEVEIPLVDEIVLHGKVYNETEGSGIENSSVLLVNLDTQDTLRVKTDSEGNYKFKNIQREAKFRVIAESEYCDAKSVDTATIDMQGRSIRIDFSLFCLSGNIVLNNIYYDLDKSNIRPDAAVELDKLVSLMKKYPEMKIELGSHTDCRASFTYNMALSKRRAASAVAYLEKNGINRKRLVAAGYGESILVNGCECEGGRVVPCTEAEHQMNRRTEIKILSLK